MENQEVIALARGKLKLVCLQTETIAMVSL